jgi:alpha-D-ribose 1-methylphosphonate 5-triphosphate synthase subunit PhnG
MPDAPTPTSGPPPAARQRWMSTLAKAAPDQVLALMPQLPPFDWLRPPEIGAVMVRGRIGGTGAPFNLGEMTITRASVRLACGAIGHGYVQGRDKGHAARAAVIDALMQGPEAARIQTEILDPLAATADAASALRAAKAAATRVDFFTLVRGEDA